MNATVIKRKFKVALDANLIPILCVGETVMNKEKNLSHSGDVIGKSDRLYP